MVAVKSTDAPTKFCKGCRYPLDHLSQPSCPECGRAFDPDDPKTFTNRAKPRRWPWYAATGFVIVFILLVPLRGLDWIRFGPRVGLHYIHWRGEQSAVAAIKAGGATSIYPDTPDGCWIPESLQNFYYTHSPVGGVEFGGTSITDETIDVIKEMRYAKYVCFCKPITLSEAQMERVGGLSHIRNLSFSDAHIPAASVAKLGRLPNLTFLTLEGSSITDESLERIKEFPQLLFLRIIRTRVTDVGLSHLRDIKGLYNLYIDDAAITDAGLASLPDLKSHEYPGYLTLRNTRVTGSGLVHLQKRDLVHVDLQGSPVTGQGIIQLMVENDRVSILADENPSTRAAHSELTRLLRPRVVRLFLYKPTTRPASPSAAP